MNREDVAMDLTFDNLDILRKEVQAAKLLLSECDEIFIEEGISNIELRGYLSGKLSADEVIELLDPPAEQRNQCDGCQAGIPLVDGAHRMGRPGGYPDLMSCQKERYENPEQAEGAQGEREACSECSGSGKVYDVSGDGPWSCYACANTSEVVGYANGDELDNMLDDRTAVISPVKTGFHTVPVYRNARAALAQPSPAQEATEDREKPEIVAFIHDRTGAVANADMVRVMEEGSVPSGYTIGLMTVTQHDRMALERWQYFRRKMRQMRDLMRGMRDRLNAAQARVAELERKLDEEEGSHIETIKQRDHAEHWADELAKAIAEQLGVDIGEHSNLNNPWNEALVSMQQPVAQAGQVPEVLFDGFAVYQALSDKAKGRTSSHNVYDTLDAVVKLMRAAAPAQGGRDE